MWAIARYGGAVIKCAASHMIDMTLHFLGRPRSLYAHVDYIPGTDFDRKATALFEYEDGLVVSFEAATHPLKRIGYERNSWDEFIQINGVNGRLDIDTVMWDHPEHNAALLVHYDNGKGISTEYRFDAVNPFDVEMAYGLVRGFIANQKTAALIANSPMAKIYIVSRPNTSTAAKPSKGPSAEPRSLQVAYRLIT